MSGTATEREEAGAREGDGCCWRWGDEEEAACDGEEALEVGGARSRGWIEGEEMGGPMGKTRKEEAASVG